MKHSLFAAVLLLPLFAGLSIPRDALCDEDGWLGVEVQKLDESLRKALDYKGDGLLVKEVYDESPASKGGISAGDIITHFKGKEIEDLEDFVDMVGDTDPGTKAEVTVLRKGKKKNLEVTISEREAPGFLGDFGKTYKDFKIKMVSSRLCLGVRIEDLSEELGEYFDTKDGALVMSVVEESPAAKAGIKAGDVIKEIDGSKIEEADDVPEALENRKDGDVVKVKLVRKGRENSFDVTLKGCESHGECCGGKHGGGHMFWSGPHGGSCIMVPDMEDLEIEDLEGLGGYLDSDDLKENIERKVKIIREIGDDKLEEIEESLSELKEEVKELKKKLEK